MSRKKQNSPFPLLNFMLFSHSSGERVRSLPCLFPAAKPFCRHASKTATATELERLSERMSPIMGRRTQ